MDWVLVGCLCIGCFFLGCLFMNQVVWRDLKKKYAALREEIHDSRQRHERWERDVAAARKEDGDAPR